MNSTDLKTKIDDSNRNLKALQIRLFLFNASDPTLFFLLIGVHGNNATIGIFL